MITFSNVTKQYEDGTKALDNVSFEIEKGEFVFLIGPSGSGKSTISRLIMHEETPTEGEITVADRVVSSMKKSDVPYLRRSVGMIFQDFRLLEDRTVYENIAFAMRIVGATKREIRRQIPALLSLVGLSHKAKMFPNHLSRGEAQRVAVARALANNPPILLADEPTASLPPKTSEEIVKLLEDINKRGTTVLMTTHAKDIVDSMQKRVIEIQDGVIVRDDMRGGYENEVK